MSNLRSFSSHQNKYTGETPLIFCTFTLYARGLGWFKKLDRASYRKVLTRDRLPKNGFLMEELIVQTTEKNAVVRDWSSKTQKEKGDSLMEGCVSNLPEYITVNVRRNNLEDLIQIWNQWDSDTRGIFTERYGNIAHLITINIVEHLIQAMIRFWDLAYQCFTFNQEDMTSTIEEYAALLRIDNVQFHKIYVKEPKFGSKPSRCVEESESFRFGHLWIDRLPEGPWTHRSWVVDFFERLKQGINLVLTILAETFRSLNSCRKIGKRRFIGCAQLLNVWILNHFWKVERTPYHIFSKTCALLEAYLEREWPKDGGIGYAPLMVQRQFSSQQFIPATGGLAQSEFAFAGEGYMKRVRDTAKP
ncbi:hypothetical protein CXB51_020648 [Gossypium anomalum]|uniref:DUF7745 domain-containing protein n=1 Tax=Gossypium anomalum TaxID=47600 RepID=A0A8J5YQL0_9ROSI|nr:hypothetical protein CXB51_020648 [Gossypium anomalum]